MSFCKDCISGVRYEGTPEGKLDKIGGVDAYIATPTVAYPKDAVILLLTDIFGYKLVNSQLLADDFARNGFKVVMIDLFNGDAVPAEAMNPGGPPFDLGEWLKGHGNETLEPLLKATYDALREQGVTKFYLTGYCFGARVAFDLSFQGLAKAIAISHPSLLQVPADFEKYKSISTAPLLVNTCEFDDYFPRETQEKAHEVMTGFAPGYKRTYWEGCTHGFAVRGDLSDPKVKIGKEGSFKATVTWFLQH